MDGGVRVPDKASPSPGPLFSPPILSGTFTITADDPAGPRMRDMALPATKTPSPVRVIGRF